MYKVLRNFPMNKNQEGYTPIAITGRCTVRAVAESEITGYQRQIKKDNNFNFLFVNLCMLLLFNKVP